MGVVSSSPDIGDRARLRGNDVGGVWRSVAFSADATASSLGTGRGRCGGEQGLTSATTDTGLDDFDCGRARWRNSSKSGIPPMLASKSRSSGSDRIENRFDERRDELEDEEALEKDRDSSGMDRRCASRSARSASAEGRGLSVRRLGVSGDEGCARGPLYRGMGSGRGVKSEGQGARYEEGELRDERRDVASSRTADMRWDRTGLVAAASIPENRTRLLLREMDLKVQSPSSREGVPDALRRMLGG